MTESPYHTMANSGYVPLTLRIGVTGHRPDKLDASTLSDNEHHVAQAYKLVTETLEELQAAAVESGITLKSMTPLVRLVSPLAEGSDRLLVSKNLAPANATLACILPFSKSEYENDFKDGASQSAGDSLTEFADLLKRAGYKTPDSQVLELTDTPGSRANGYRRAGEAVVHHSDLLIALFNGKHNDSGGTWSTILEARRCSVPVIIIDSTGKKGPTLLYAGGPAENDDETALTIPALRNALARSLLLVQDSSSEKEGTAIADFSNEPGLKQCVDSKDTSLSSPQIVHKGPLTHWTPPAFQLLKSLFARKNRVSSLRKQWSNKTTEQTREVAENNQSLAQQRVDATYKRADALAVHYATVHRNTFVAIYMLGAGALIAAALGLAGLALNTNTPAQSIVINNLPLICVFTECFLLVGIYVLYKRDHLLHFHRKWLQYRSLAEVLRPQRFFVMAGSASGLSLLRRNHNQTSFPDYGPSDQDDHWIYLYAANVIRWAGFDAGQCNTDRRLTNKNAIIEQWLRPQIDYHEENAANMHVMESWLASLGVVSFRITFVVVVAKLITKFANLFGTEFQVWAGFLAAFFPIVGTLMFAVRNHAEFGISAKRSLAMRKVYLHLINEFERGETSRAEQIMTLNQVFSQAISESNEWRTIYEVKESETA